MAIKPILFNTEMVRAILEGRKTQTRRVLKPAHGGSLEIHDYPFGTRSLCERCGSRCRGLKPPCEPGDVLWVPEAWKCVGIYGELGYEVVLRSGRRVEFEFESRERARKWAKYRDKPPHQWQSPYFMPKEAAQIFLYVKDVRVERLRDIDDDGVVSEGLEIGALFDELWNSTIKKADLPRYCWNANPWVWVVTFKQCEKPEGWCE